MTPQDEARRDSLKVRIKYIFLNYPEFNKDKLEYMISELGLYCDGKEIDEFIDELYSGYSNS